MKAEALRKSILQMAIEGKLVAQNPADEPASVLLEKIRAEKQRLIQEGKIKKDKYDSVIFRGDDKSHYEKVGGKTVCIDDEIPFDIPDSWVWVRQETICWLDSGKKVSGISLPYLEAKVLRGEKEPATATQGVLIDIGTKAILVDGENSGEVFDVWLKGFLGSTFKILTCVESISKEYLFILFELHRDIYRNRKTGAAIPHLNKTLFKSMLIPLPPLAEQERIVVKTNESLPFIEMYEKFEQDESKLNAELPDRLRKSILQHAIQGKLVPQDPTDEPAYVLLERIRAEKEALIKAGKIKRDKTDSYIYRGDDNSYYEKLGTEVKNIEVPFDLPESWTWVKLGLIVLISGGGTPDKTNSKFWNGNIPWASVKDIKGVELHKTIDSITDAGLKSKTSISVCEVDDLIVVTRLVPGRSIICKIKAAINQDLKRIQTSIDVKYLNYWFETTLEYFSELGQGTTVLGIKVSDLQDILFPLPPLTEQIRIVYAIEAALKKIQLLKS